MILFKILRCLIIEKLFRFAVIIIFHASGSVKRVYPLEGITCFANGGIR